MNISQMTLSDLERIKDILNTEFDNFWSYNTLLEELKQYNSYLIVCKNDNNEIVGFAGIKIILDEADIMNIVVKKTNRKNGIGTLMLEHLIDYSKNKKLKTITLEVNENNTSAINLYNKFTFKNIGIRKKYYNNKFDAIIMTKEL